MEFRGVMGGFYRISEWIMRLAVINVLWIVFSIPFFYILLATLLTPDATNTLLIQSAILLGCIAPFTLIPATAAMFAVARKWVMGDEDVPLFKTFIRTYRENYRQSMVGSLIFLVLGGVFVVNYRFYISQNNGLSVLAFVFLAFSIVMIAAFFNFMSILVHYEMKMLQMVKNAFIVTLGQPFMSISMIVTNALIFYFSGRFTFLIPFFMGSLCAITTFWYFYRGLQRIQAKLEANQQKAEEQKDLLDEQEAALVLDEQQKQ